MLEPVAEAELDVEPDAVAEAVAPGTGVLGATLPLGSVGSGWSGQIAPRTPRVVLWSLRSQMPPLVAHVVVACVKLAEAHKQARSVSLHWTIPAALSAQGWAQAGRSATVKPPPFCAIAGAINPRVRTAAKK